MKKNLPISTSNAFVGSLLGIGIVDDPWKNNSHHEDLIGDIFLALLRYHWIFILLGQTLSQIMFTTTLSFVPCAIESSTQNLCPAVTYVIYTWAIGMLFFDGGVITVLGILVPEAFGGASLPGGQATYLENPVPRGTLPTILAIESLVIAFVEYECT